MPKKDTKLQKLSETIYITVEEMKKPGVEGLDRMFMKEYLQQADRLTDCRGYIVTVDTMNIQKAIAKI